MHPKTWTSSDAQEKEVKTWKSQREKEHQKLLNCSNSNKSTLGSWPIKAPVVAPNKVPIRIEKEVGSVSTPSVKAWYATNVSAGDSNRLSIVVLSTALGQFMPLRSLVVATVVRL
ncbi:hypothetical protein Tco_0349448 [Tanacetum coccineum]